MSDPELVTYADQFAEIIRHFIRLKPHLRPMHGVDAEAAGMIARLMATRPHGSANGGANFDLLYSVCVILTQQGEPISMGELSQALDVPLSTATRIVGWLVKNGYIARVADPEDRRIVRVTLTETGHAMHQAGNELIRKRAEVLLGRFTASEREQMVRLAAKLAQSLEDET